MSAQTGSVRWASTPPQSGRPAPVRSRPRPRPAALILAVVMLVACTVVIRASVLGDELPMWRPSSRFCVRRTRAT